MAKVAYNTGDQDFSAQLTQVINSVLRHCSCLVTSATWRSWPSSSGLCLEDSPDGRRRHRRSGLVIIGGEAAEGIVFSTFYSAEAPATLRLRSSSMPSRPHGKPPQRQWRTGLDTYNILVDAIRRAGSDDPKAIRDALANTVDFLPSPRPLHH